MIDPSNPYENHKHADYAIDIGVHSLTMDGKTKEVVMWCTKCGAYACVTTRAKNAPRNGDAWLLPSVVAPKLT